MKSVSIFFIHHAVLKFAFTVDIPCINVRVTIIWKSFATTAFAGRGSRSLNGSKVGSFAVPIFKVSRIPDALQPLNTNSLPFYDVSSLYKSIIHLACNGYITVRGVLTSMLIPLTNPSFIFFAYHIANFSMYLLAHKFTVKSKG